MENKSNKDMKAAVFYGKGDIRIERLPIPVPAPDEIKIQVRAAALAGVDPLIFDGIYPAKSGIIGGWQASGDVAEAGSAVIQFKKGDRVTFDPNINCFKCHYCQTGHPLLCERLEGCGTSRSGAFAEYFTVREANLYHLPDTVTYEQATFTEHLACVVHAVERAQVELADTVAVLGVGVVGNMFVQLIKGQGAARIIAVDLSRTKLEMAREVGADTIVNADQENSVKALLDITKGKGVDVLIDAVGRPQVLEEGLQAVAKGGRILVFATHPIESTITIKPFQLYEREWSLIGSYCNPLTFDKALNLIASGGVKVNHLISAEVPLDEIVKGIEIKRQPETVAVLVRP